MQRVASNRFNAHGEVLIGVRGELALGTTYLERL